ncbi:MAG: chorismate-binding protein [Proteobacteria bacterium]|nr:chorismate-binding protein [Pseudomonadota bacterium]
MDSIHTEKLASLSPLRVQARARDRFPVCLYSATSTNLVQARFSYLPEQPKLVLSRDSQGQTWLDGSRAQSFDDCLDTLVAQRRSTPSTHQPPFVSGWLIYYGFESYLGWRDLDGGRGSGQQGSLPMACLWRVDRLFVHDNECDQWQYFSDRHLGDDAVKALGTHLGAGEEGGQTHAQLTHTLEESEQDFIAACQKIIDAVVRGDVIQVNLSRLWRLHFSHPLSVGRLALELSRLNPSPFFCTFELGDETIISASPERLFRVRGDRIQTRPLGGTVERFVNDSHADEQMRRQLHEDAKLSSEHIMLVDLERNDLSRLCRPNSVSVPSLAQVETHPFLHHLNSKVEGVLRPDTRFSEIFRAMCPGGSISGCPKKMCLQMLSELESGARQWYTGAFGYIDDSGAADVNLLIRSLAVRDREIYFRTGAGVVSDSDPVDELAETRLKAHGLLRAIHAACADNDA